MKKAVIRPGLTLFDGFEHGSRSLFGRKVTDSGQILSGNVAQLLSHISPAFGHLISTWPADGYAFNGFGRDGQNTEPFLPLRINELQLTI